MRQTLFILTAISAFLIFSASTSFESTREFSKCPYLERIHKASVKSECPYLQNKRSIEDNVKSRGSKCPYLENHKIDREKPVEAKKVKIT